MTDKILLKTIAEAISSAEVNFASAISASESRIRHLENTVALLNDNHAKAILELRRKTDEDAFLLRGEIDMLEAQLAEAKSVAGRHEVELQSVNSLAVQLGINDIPNLRKSMESALAESQLALLLRVDDVTKGLEEHEERVGQLEDIAGATGVDVQKLNDELNKRFSATSELVDILAARVSADTKSYPAYVEGEIVRAGSIRRFGFGGLFEALVDTAKGALNSPDSWQMISDGLYVEEHEKGVQLKSYSDGLLHTLAFPKDGEKGDEGQRGKQGVQGLRGNDGVGVDEVITTDTGMYVSLTNSKHYHFDFTPQLERAIRDVAPRIEQIAINAVINGGEHVD